MDAATIKKLARKIFQAEVQRKAIPPFTETSHPDMTIEEAYKIQLAAVDLKLKAGQRIVGKKIGLTNIAVQKARGISEPDYGHIMDVLMGNQDLPLKLSALTSAPAVEAELAFVLNKDLQGPGVTAGKVIEATAGVMPALEIVERRFFPLCKSVKDSICDNAACGRIVLGAKLTPVPGLDFRTIGLVIEKNGQPIDMSCSAAVLGSPAESVAWLANKLAGYGVGLKAGEIVMSGSIGLMHAAQAGDCFYAHFGNGVGSVKVSFVE
ncbi:MAG: 2-keto-4-pentenoate hydratase [Desulfarculus sp.]|jgi:2-keto-4-pentenoate hydratase|nr:MAG: 2-keto-4-pentenoate hydratase [Desulfarculus sp.]